MLALLESDVLGQVILFIIERFPLFGVSFNGGSTVYSNINYTWLPPLSSLLPPLQERWSVSRPITG